MQGNHFSISFDGVVLTNANTIPQLRKGVTQAVVSRNTVEGWGLGFLGSGFRVQGLGFRALGVHSH